MPSEITPGSSKTSTSGDANTHINSGMSPNREDSSLSIHCNGDPPGLSYTSTNTLSTQSSSRLPPFTPSSTSQMPPFSDLPIRGHSSVQPPPPNRPTAFLSHRGTLGIGALRGSNSVSSRPSTDLSSKTTGMGSSLSQPKKAPTKPMWVDVSVLPRIPKIKRENATGYNTSESSSNVSSSSRGSSRESSSFPYGMPETGINSLAGDKNRQQSVDQHKETTGGQPQTHRPDGSGSSSAFSNSFSSSSSTSHPASQPHYSSSSSSVSFRINSSGNSWHSRRLSIPSCSAGGDSMQENRREKENAAKRRQLHKDKQMLLASCTVVSKEQDSNSIYDPFNPTLSDSSSSDGEDESSSLDSSSRNFTHDMKPVSLGNKDGIGHRKLELVQVKMETQEVAVSQEEPKRASSQEIFSPEESATVEKVLRLVDTKVEKQTTLLELKVKKEPGLYGAGEDKRKCHSPNKYSETADTHLPANHTNLLKIEKGSLKQESRQSKNDSSASSSAPTKKRQKSEFKSESASKSSSSDLDLNQKILKEQHSSSSETEKGARGDHHSAKGDGQKETEKDRERSSRGSGNRERRARSVSKSSQSSSPERSHRKRQRSRSQSKDRRRSRSVCNNLLICDLYIAF